MDNDRVITRREERIRFWLEIVRTLAAIVAGTSGLLVLLWNMKVFPF